MLGRLGNSLTKLFHFGHQEGFQEGIRRLYPKRAIQFGSVPRMCVNEERKEREKKIIFAKKKSHRHINE